jgi:type II secretory pathway component GspD/PulD (secretin)
VMMQFYTNISTLDSLNKVSSGTSSSSSSVSIQVPTVSTRNFLQRVAIKSGETLVISGYEGITDTSSQQGIGTASNYALGGGFDANRAREVLVILLTPITMNGS